QDRYLRENYPPYGAARMIEAMVPVRERVFSTTGVPQAYTSREILTGYESAFNQLLADSLENGWNENIQPRLVDHLTFPETPVRRIRLVSALDAPAQWGIHELRFYDKGVETPRQPAWRLTASPDPWEVQLAFDNSPVTRWRSDEPLRRGMYVQVDFGGEQRID